jgi:uncharacterized protein
MDPAKDKYIRFTTTKKDGTPVSTPVWLVDLGGGRAGFYTSSTSGKAKRLRHTPRAVIQASDMRGNPIAGRAPSEVAIEIVSGEQLADIHRRVRSKYGAFQVNASHLGAVVGGWVKRKKQPYGDVGVTFAVPPSGPAATSPA